MHLLALLAFGHLLGIRDWAMRLHAVAPGPVRGVVWFLLVVGIYWQAAAPAEFIYFVF
jgi:hypothetical protein